MPTEAAVGPAEGEAAGLLGVRTPVREAVKVALTDTLEDREVERVAE